MSQRVLIVAFDFPPHWGGVATYGFELATGLVKRGFDVTVLTGESDSETTEIEGLNILRVKLARSGMASIPLLAFHLGKLVKSQTFDAIFCCLWLPDGVATHLALKLTKTDTPYFVSVHAMEIMESRETAKKRFREKLKPLKKRTFANAKKIFCVSHYSQKLLHNLVQLPDDKSVVINNGANPKKFYPAKEKNSHPGPRLFTACRLIPNKGVDQVIKALPDLVKNHPHLQYRVAGDGRDHSRLLKLTEMMQMQDHVQFLGKIDDHQLLVEYQQADLFVMLSRQEKHHVEGFGLVFLEAALCGTPSLGGKSGGISDAIEEGVTGWLVDPYSDTAIAKKLSNILQDPEHLKNVGQTALQKTLAEKTWDHRIEEFIREAELC